MAIVIPLLGFNDLGCSVTPTFLFRYRFYIQLSPHYPKMNKKSMWEVKKVSRFLSTGHGILPFCGRKACETMVAKCQPRPQGLLLDDFQNGGSSEEDPGQC